MSKFNPKPDELRKRASLFWPKEFLEKEASASIIPLLVGTQDKFISILDVSEKRPDSWKLVMQQTEEISPNLFLKHLMVLADMGGEPLKRLRPRFAEWFPDGKMEFKWRGSSHHYLFREIIGCRQLDNRSLFVDGVSLAHSHELTGAMEDVIMLILHGASVANVPLPEMIADRCVVGTLIGNKAELQRFVKQRYIFVSRITGGATANALGQIAQDYVRDLLHDSLPGWEISRNGTIPGMSQNAGNTDMNFDIVAKSPSNRYFAVEVSYQVTTNSTIERKQGQAQGRAALLHKSKHKICYVIDGAGNFEREAALRTICRFSDCTVAFGAAEIELLVEFLKKNA